MEYDCIIIGGGIAGLTCGIKCLKGGLRCAIISAGSSALHFSSGSIDFLGYGPDQKAVFSPFEALASFLEACPDHPYAKCGRDRIAESFDFLQEELRAAGLVLLSNSRDNHFHVTALGTLKPTYFSQASVFNDGLRAGFARKARIAILTFQGFRDFYPSLCQAHLSRNPLFKECPITIGALPLEPFIGADENPYEFRSIDLARIFDQGRFLEQIASQIKKISAGAEIVGLPAFLGITRFSETHKQLQEMTGRLIYEIPTLPPSILGLRIERALKSRFAELGGIFIHGDRVTGGTQENSRITQVRTAHIRGNILKGRFFVLATGSFFSGGLASGWDRIGEPVFGFQLENPSQRNTWYSPRFFDPASHPFLSFGVKTNESFHPFDENGRVVTNLFCAGAVLAGYNPVREGSGGGVAASTGYWVANKIIEDYDTA